MKKVKYDQASQSHTILTFLGITALAVLMLVSIANAAQVADQINSPNHSINLYYKGVALKNLGKLDEAIKAYDEALEINSQYFEAWNGKGLALSKLGKLDEAIKAYDKAIELNQ